jgi:hypothetical protein
MDLASATLERRILRLPWRAVLSAPLVKIAAMEQRPARSCAAAVPFLGVWCGWVTMRCDLELAHEISSRTRGQELVRASDIDDATRWLVEVIAQSMQPVLDPQARLGPATVLDPDEAFTPRWCRPAARMLFASAGRAVGVALDERLPLVLRSTGVFPSDLDDAKIHDRETAEYPTPPKPPISRRKIF